jgi:hypothetical protein
MPPCHTMPFIRPGILVEPTRDSHSDEIAPRETCDYCGSAQLTWRKCKLICTQCRQINKSCADL